MVKFFKKTKYNNSFYSENLDLTELANKYGTDKGYMNVLDLPWSRDYPKHNCWGYTKVYEKYMLENRKKDVSLLEIGVADPRFPYSSLKMWMSYFKNLNLYALDNFWDNDLSNKIEDIKKLNDDGINFIYANQGSYSDWDEIYKKIPDKLDYIIDDASHWSNHIMVGLWKSLPLLKKGGYYFIEDIQNPLKSKAWYKYDNSILAQEFLESTITKNLNSLFLNDKQNDDINNGYELMDIHLTDDKIFYMIVLKKK